jgi:hypothetical protein
MHSATGKPGNLLDWQWEVINRALTLLQACFSCWNHHGEWMILIWAKGGFDESSRFESRDFFLAKEGGHGLVHFDLERSERIQKGDSLRLHCISEIIHIGSFRDRKAGWSAPLVGMAFLIDEVKPNNKHFVANTKDKNIAQFDLI